MRFPFYIARRWANSSNEKHSTRILRIGVYSIALCIGIIIISVCVLVGFKEGISDKVFGFGSHLQIIPYNIDANSGFIDLSDSNIKKLSHNKYIKSIEPFIYKEGLLRGKNESLGIFFKGICPNYDTSFFSSNLLHGRMPQLGNIMSSEIIISEKTAATLELNLGDKARTYFISGQQLRPRAFTIVGIYKTGLSQFDATYIIGDIRQAQLIEGFSENMASGIDISLHNPNLRQYVQSDIDKTLPYHWSSYTCDELFPEIFDWLALIDVNVWVLMIILFTVALISLISILFICMISHHSHASILRFMGAGKDTIFKIFFWQTFFLLGKGLVIGNIFGLLICLIQHYFQIMKLNPDVYFLSFVPVSFPFTMLISLNTLCILIAGIVLFCVSAGASKKYSI